jgi:glycolate oxidase iron-sulfur subunit
MTDDAAAAVPSDVLAPFAAEGDRLLACVHCGFCLDSCPTYTRLGVEADSPRGRLYLMRAVAEGRMRPDADAFQLHIDRCLGCRACEPVCPSGVQYGYLLERARDVINRAHKGRGAGSSTRMLLRIVANRTLGSIIWFGGRLLRDTGMARFLARALPARLTRARFAMAMLAASRPWRGLRSAAPAARPDAGRESGSLRDTAHAHAPAAAPAATVARAAPEPAGTRVALLRGCVQQGLFAHVNQATARVLRANGCTLMPVTAQGCCGALHAHAGQLDQARALARANLGAFEKSGADRIVVNAAGCGAMMKGYSELFEHTAEHERATAFATRVVDVNELLAELGPRPGAPLELRAGYDAPCHLLHAQRVDRAPLIALGAIAGLEVAPLPRADECCGGAGTYGLTHPDLGRRILSDKVAAVLGTGADVVVTPNPGCMMQIGAGLLLAGDDRPVLHPVELLDESYRRGHPATDDSRGALP